MTTRFTLRLTPRQAAMAEQNARLRGYRSTAAYLRAHIEAEHARQAPARSFAEQNPDATVVVLGDLPSDTGEAS